MSEIKDNFELDDVLDKFGVMKRYHLEKMILIFVAFLVNEIHYTNYVFAAEEVSYR